MRTKGVILALCLLAICGCKGESADSGVDLSALREQAKGMDATKLQSTIDEYKGKIAGLEEKAKEVSDQIKGMAPKDLLSDAGKKLKDESKSILGDVSSWKEKLEVFVQELASRK